MARIHLSRRTILLTALVVLAIGFVALTWAAAAGCAWRGWISPRTSSTPSRRVRFTSSAGCAPRSSSRSIFPSMPRATCPSCAATATRQRDAAGDGGAVAWTTAAADRRSRALLRRRSQCRGYGLTPISGGSNGERVFFGLVGSTLSPNADSDSDSDGDGEGHLPGKTLAIPLFDPSRETFLEYDIAKLLYELDEPSKPRVGLISSLPVQGNPVIGEEPWTAMRQLEPAVRYARRSIPTS